MSGSFFNVENNLIDRNDLNIYEKMCSVVLARYAGRSEFSNMLNTQVIAIRMGCSVKEAEKALSSLIEKKLVTLEDTEHIEPELLTVEAVKVSSRVIKSEGASEMARVAENIFEHLEVFEEEPKVEKPKQKRKPKEAVKKVSSEQEAPKSKVEEPKQPVSEETKPRPLVPKQVREDVQSLIDQIFEVIDENINDREARIILSFANNDIDLVREKYKVAKRSQVSDKIEMLINELQKKEESPKGDSKASLEAGGINPEATPKVLQNAQIDLENINRMVAFKQSSYNKQNKKF